MKAPVQEDSRLQGQYYEAVVPDTLDLAERARLAVNALTGSADPRNNYEIFQCAHLARPRLARDARLGDFCDYQQGTPVQPRTDLRLLWTETHLYLLAECAEPDMAGLSKQITEADGEVWTDDLSIHVQMAPDE